MNPTGMEPTGIHSLQQRLHNRHIQLIALGGAIGTGLFLGSAGVLERAGPSMLLAYAFAGAMVFLIMRFLGEMLVETPVSSSFAYFADRYWGRFAGYFSGWNTVVLYVLVGMVELSAAGKFVQFWWPTVPGWLTAALGLLAITGLNLASVRAYGESEFWFAMVKVVAVLSMIGFGVWLLVAHHGSPGVGLANLWSQGGFLPHGVSGLIMSLGLVAFAFGGIEMIGFAAAETRDPSRVIPKAINQIVYRVLLFYVASSLVLLSLYPWQGLLRQLQAGGGTYSSSPFALIFSVIGDQLAANLLNLVILSAALSVYNGIVYSTSRLFYGMARQGNAPAFFGVADRRGVPVRALGMVSAATAACVLLNYLIPRSVIEVLMSLVTASLLLLWGVIVFTHLHFRRAMREAGVRTGFPALFSPWSNYACLAFLGLVAAVLLVAPQTRATVLAIPVWVLAVWLAYLLRERLRRAPPVVGGGA